MSSPETKPVRFVAIKADIGPDLGQKEKLHYPKVVTSPKIFNLKLDQIHSPNILHLSHFPDIFKFIFLQILETVQ